MTPEDALAMARRIARRTTRDTAIATTDDYTSLAAYAILEQSKRNDDPALLWTVGRASIIDQWRQLHKARGQHSERAYQHVEFDDTRDAPIVDGAETAAVSAAGVGELRVALDMRPQPLTRYQRRVVLLLAAGVPLSEAAKRLGVSYENVKSLVRSARLRLGARTNEQLILIMLMVGYLEVERIAA